MLENRLKKRGTPRKGETTTLPQQGGHCHFICQKCSCPTVYKVPALFLWQWWHGHLNRKLKDWASIANKITVAIFISLSRGHCLLNIVDAALSPILSHLGSKICAQWEWKNPQMIVGNSSPFIEGVSRSSSSGRCSATAPAPACRVAMRPRVPSHIGGIAEWDFSF